MADTGISRSNIAVESSRQLDAGQVEQVVAVIEDRGRTGEWHPLVRRVDSGPRETTEERFHPVQDFEGLFAGVPVSGVSEVAVWERGREYAFLNRERSTGLVAETRFIIDAGSKDSATVTATVSMDLPREAAALLNEEELTRLLSEAIEQALDNVTSVAAAPVGSV